MWKSSFLLLIMMILVTGHGSAQLPDPIPDPDNSPAAMEGPVKVFILLGQSNMLGFGRVLPEETQGTLTYLTKKENKYPHLVDDTGAWTQRADVRHVQVMH